MMLLLEFLGWYLVIGLLIAACSGRILEQVPKHLRWGVTLGIILAWLPALLMGLFGAFEDEP